MTMKLMPNRRRGEIGAMLDGEPRVLCLTLGALAELEAAFDVDNLSALAARFSDGGLSTRDITRILGAGLRGAGHSFTDEDVGLMSVEGGAAGAARLVSDLLIAAFSPGAVMPDVSANP